MAVEANIFTFDTYDFVKRLIGAGMPEARAEILAREQSRMAREWLANKQDIMEVKRAIQEVRREITIVGQKLTIRFGAMLIVGVIFLAAFDRFF